MVATLKCHNSIRLNFLALYVHRLEAADKGQSQASSGREEQSRRAQIWTSHREEAGVRANRVNPCSHHAL